ncbi:MAG: beta-galactosidase, partial [Lentisphaerae bacterium]|nr:beta-galactosidase [Lentisphaerota bacterium]
MTSRWLGIPLALGFLCTPPFSGAERIVFAGKTPEQLTAAGVTPVTKGAPAGMMAWDWAGHENPAQEVILRRADELGLDDGDALVSIGRSWCGGVQVPVDVEPRTLYRVRLRARVVSNWLLAYAVPPADDPAAGATLDSSCLLGSTGVMRGHGWRTYTFEFVTLPGQRRAWIGLTNWQKGALVLDWLDCEAVTPLPAAAMPPASPAPDPADIGVQNVWIFDEPGFPERSVADAAFWTAALEAAGHRVRRVGVSDLAGPAPGEAQAPSVLVLPNRGYLPVDAEPAIFDFLAAGGAVIIGGSLESTVGGPGGELPADAMREVFAGTASPDDFRIPGGKWLRRGPDGAWTTPWELYSLKCFPYVSLDFRFSTEDQPYHAPARKNVAPGTTLTPCDWLEPYGVPFPPSLVATQSLSVPLPLDWVGPAGQCRYVSRSEDRDNVYMGLYATDTPRPGEPAAGDAFIMRYHSRHLPAGTLVHLGALADRILEGTNGPAVAAGLVRLACQPRLPGERPDSVYAAKHRLADVMDRAGKAYAAAEDYLKDHLGDRARHLPELTQQMHRMLLLNRMAADRDADFPVVLPETVSTFFRGLTAQQNRPPPDPAWAAALRREAAAAAERVERLARPWADRNNAERLARPWPGKPLIIGGMGDGYGGYRHVARLAGASREIGFDWIGRTTSNEIWMPRLFDAFGIRTYVGMGYVQGFQNPLLYAMSNEWFDNVSAAARLFRDRPYIAAHGTGCELMPTVPVTPAQRDMVNRQFQTWLSDTYKDIAALNACWGTTYATWDEISVPDSPALATPSPAHAPWEDYTRSVQALFEEFHRRMSAALRRGDPGRPVISQFHEPVGGRVQQGLHKVRLHQYEDLDGTHENVSTHDWLRFGLARAPLCNEEWHGILWSRGDSLDNCFRSLERMSVELAQGQVGWIFFPYTTFAEYRGALFDQTGFARPGTWGFRHLTRRLQRLGELARRGRSLPARVAMLHSDTAFRHTSHLDPAYMAERAGWWNVLNRAGIPLAIVDETRVTVRTLQAFDMLIVPYCPYLPVTAAEAIEAYANAGGAVVLQLPGLPAADPYAQPRRLFEDSGMPAAPATPSDP